MDVQCYAFQTEEEAQRLIEAWSTPERPDDDRKNLMVDLGFNGRLDHETRQARRINNLRVAKTLYPEMTGPDLQTWRRFLPTTETPQSFTFDAIPIEALEQIKLAKAFRCFDEIQIWTPVGNGFLALIAGRFHRAKQWLENLAAQLDPMAVGVMTDEFGGKHYFQIVRWGEALLPLKQIRRHVRAVHTAANLLFFVLPIMIALILFAGFTAWAIRDAGYISGAATVVAVLIIGAIIAAASKELWYRPVKLKGRSE